MTGLDFGGVAAISLFSWDGGHASGTKNQFHVTSFAPHASISCPHVVSSLLIEQHDQHHVLKNNSPRGLLSGLLNSFLRCVRPLCTAVSVSALQSFTFVSQLWAAVAASALQSFVSQLWTSQALVSILKSTNCLGSTVV